MTLMLLIIIFSISIFHCAGFTRLLMRRSVKWIANQYCPLLPGDKTSEVTGSSPLQCSGYFRPMHKNANIFENHRNPAMLVLIGYAWSTLRWVPIFQGFSNFSWFLHYFILANFGTSSIRVNIRLSTSTLHNNTHIDIKWGKVLYHLRYVILLLLISMKLTLLLSPWEGSSLFTSKLFKVDSPKIN